MELKSLYETIFIVNNTLGAETLRAVVDKFTGLITDNGEVETINEWGVRRLAYPIDDYVEGYYVLVRFTAVHSFPAELDRIFNITDGILRSLTVKIDK